MSHAAQLEKPLFTAPVRWALRVLSWTAFGASAYLAWHAVNQTQVAGCGVDSQTGCDMVLSSVWSNWLGVPVAVAGLACYATLAALSVLLGVQNPRASRWISTTFIMLALIAAVASFWFLALQVIVIGHFCRFCIVADICGIVIGAIAVWATIRWLNETRYMRRSQTATTGLMALRNALPSAKGSAPAVVLHNNAAPSLAVALGGAGVVTALLVFGQILFPAKRYDVQQVALSETITMNGANGNEPSEPRPFEADTRVVMRMPSDSADNGEATQNNADDSAVVAAEHREPADESTTKRADEPSPNSTAAANDQKNPPDSSDEEASPAAEPARQRVVKFLGGKLKLDVYKHPLIGSPEAPHVLVEMVSYDCPHCRNTHRVMKQALSRYGDQVAIILMVIPLERGCNKLVTNSAGSHRGACSTARMALGVATLRPTAFPKFHDWLMADKEKPPGLDKIIARAYSIVDRERLRELSSSEQLKKQIEGYVNLFATLRNQHTGNKEYGLPVQILGDHVMTGTVDKAQDLYRAWEEHLGVKPR
ncbi:MAG: vitamin K epoxide reductase family protein [Pirellulales bacterium]